MVKPKSVTLLAVAPLLMLSFLLSALALAQDPPRVQLDTPNPVAGEPLTLLASGLEPDGEYRLRIEGPNDALVQETLTAGGDGELSHTFELADAGEWTLALTGEGVSASLVLLAADPEAAEATGEEPAAAEENGGADADDELPAEAPEGAEQDAGDETSDDGAPAEGDAQQQPDRTATERPAPAAGDSLTITTEGDAILGMRGDRRVWRFDFPAGTGGTGAVLETDDAVWVGHGISVLLLDKGSGQAVERFAMPGRVIRLEGDGDTVSVVSDVDGTLRQRIEVDRDGPRSTVRFGTDPEPFGWLRREADVADPAGRLESDPTNPWLHLSVGLATRSTATRAEHLEQALRRANTFYDLAGLARALHQAGEQELARDAMNLAMRDFAERGYTPELLTNAELHRAYDFPLAPMEQALAQEDLDSARFWAPWLYLMSSEETPESRAALNSYADRLAAVGQRDAANLWRERAQGGRSASPAASLDRFFLGLGRSGWYAVAALVATILALHLTLVAKYWAPQTLAIRRGRETGSSRKPWARLLAIRYYSLTEKLVLVLLFAATLTLLGLTHWYDSAGERPAALGTGSLASPVARDVVTSAPLEGPRAAFIRGYAAQSAGERGPAREEYLAAGDYPPALNNLAALLDDDVLYRRALELAPGMPEAAYNLGRATDPSAFHDAFLADRPLLAVPGNGDFRTAVSGTWQGAIAGSFENPWRALRDTRFFGLPTILWQILLALFLIWVLVTVVWLVIPRPGLARNAPRTGAYHLLALLIPGSGLADEAWGILLLLPWALLSVDALSQWLGWNRSLGLPLQTELWALAAIYLVNFVAFVVEFVSYRRRMRNLRRRHPEAVEAYGLRS